MRFDTDEQCGCVIDKKCNEELVDIFDCCKKLNELSKENEILKKQNENLVMLNARLQNKIAYNDQHYGERARKSFEGIEDWASGGH